MNKGLIQNIVIVVLLATSLLLISIRFELFVASGSAGAVTSENKTALRYSVMPGSITLRLGPENAVKIVDKSGFYYMEISRVLEESIGSRTETLPITASDYRTKKESKGIQLNFDPAIDHRLLYGSLFLEDGSLGSFDKIKEIWIPQGYDTSIYLAVDEATYYEIKNPKLNTVSGFGNFDALNNKKYYSISERFPNLTDNDVLISDEARLPSFVTQAMVEEEDIERILRALLGSKYDFSGRVSDIDGSTVVSYDYGREIVKITPEGKVFYYNKSVGLQRQRMSFTDAMSIATELVSEIGSEQEIYVIEGVEEVQDGDSLGYRFSFSKRIDGVRVSLKTDEPVIRVLVMNGRVTAFEGLFRKAVVEVDNNLSFGENAVLLILEKNYDYIQEREPFGGTSELLDNIRSVEYAYIYSPEYNYIASYRMVIGDTTFFFKIEDAEVIT